MLAAVGVLVVVKAPRGRKPQRLFAYVAVTGVLLAVAYTIPLLNTFIVTPILFMPMFLLALMKK
jgi:hypothetical protein